MSEGQGGDGRADGRAGTVLFFANGLGDTIINRPAFCALAAHLPRPIRLICAEDRGLFLWRGLGIDAIHPLKIERLPDGGRLFDVASVPADWFPCEVFATMVPWFSSSLDELVRAASPRRSYGLERGFDVNIPLDYDKNSVELGFDVARAAIPGANIASYRKPLSFDAQCVAGVDRLLHKLASNGMNRIVSVHTETIANKQWDIAHFRGVLCRLLSTREDIGVVMVDYYDAGVACECHAHRIVRLPGLKLESAMNIVTRSDLFIGIDSCMLHAADLADVPGVVLFGPDTRPEEFGYYWRSAVHLRFASQDDATPADALVAAALSFLSQPRPAAAERHRELVHAD